MYPKTESGSYQAECAIINLLSPLKNSPLPEAKSAQMTEFRASQLAKDQKVNVHMDRMCAFGIEHNFEIL